MLNALAAALSPGKGLCPTPSTHRLRRGLPGYLILFAPHAFEPQRQLQSRAAFATGVPPYIYAFHRYTWNSTLPSALKFDSFQSILWLSHSLLLQTYQTACARFTPNKSGQRSGPTYYRGCWHVVSRPFLVSYRHCVNFPLSHTFFSYNRALRSENLLHSRGVARSGFPHCRRFPTAASRRSLGRVSVPVWPITLSGRLCIDRLGEPLPHQLANQRRSIS